MSAKTIQECYLFLDEDLDSDLKSEFRAESYNGGRPTECDFIVSLSVRKNLIFFNEDNTLMDFFYGKWVFASVDDITDVIMKGYHLHLNDEPAADPSHPDFPWGPLGNKPRLHFYSA